MDTNQLKRLLSDFQKGNLDIETVMTKLKTLPFEEIGFATIDSHRSLRQGFPEVIFGEGKTAKQIIGIAERLYEKKENILITRVSVDKAKVLKKRFPKFVYNDVARTVVIKSHPIKINGIGKILVVSAGTSDIPVAEEARVTAEIMGNDVETLYDVGVAGIHRLLHKKEKLFKANVLLVVAGMEGALPSVVAGIVSKPVIAVPTSVGYGANLGGIATLLAMLNSCASGVTVVNIDNGFGAGYAASLINRK
ncbi:MAG: nickel pincer cofactor biosynthesis protein LarB [Deltaproteobacteria bacterium]|nr:nickel pincer cofactor biosynthesis protein LarB [Deltaproteobacteria bacterium]